MEHTFNFRFDSRFAPLLGLGGITPGRSWVVVDDEFLRVRFGGLKLTTPRDNILEASVTGPHQPIRAIGVRMSLTDRGLTFGTSVERMVCVQFREPVRARPVDVTPHPGLSLSVERPEELVALLNGAA
jgi:hypothetical protein